MVGDTPAVRRKIKVSVTYLGALAAEAGLVSEEFCFPDTPSLSDVLSAVRASRGPAVGRLVADDLGAAQPFLLITVNRTDVPYGQNPAVADGSEIWLALAVSGG